jgi:hypothetical protein
MTPDQSEELKILRLASGKGKFAIPVGARMGPSAQFALERLQERDWIRLIDLAPLASMPGLYRVFLLTKPALAFLKKSAS